MPMAAINEAISRYHRGLGLPVVGDRFWGYCTGGAQSQFVTHPMVKTWYISGANIPFAGPDRRADFCPTCTLANYLSDCPVQCKVC